MSTMATPLAAWLLGQGPVPARASTSSSLSSGDGKVPSGGSLPDIFAELGGYIIIDSHRRNK